MNRVCLTGRLAEMPVLKTTTTGKSVCTVRVAVRQGKGKTDFFRCTAWQGTAEHLCRWFQKGQMIAIEGRLQTVKWTDKYGQKRTDVEVVVDEVGFCGAVEKAPSVCGCAAASSPAEAGAPCEVAPAAHEIEEIADGDLPF